MPAAVKPLFRPEALRPKLSAFTVPPAAVSARAKLSDWAQLLASRRAEKMKETELLSDFLGDVFVRLLGYTGPASGADSYTLKREATAVDGKYADAALGRFSTAGGSAEVVAVLEGKGPRDPLDRPFAGRNLSAVNQAVQYAVNLVCDWYLVSNLHEIRLYHKGHDQLTYERFGIASLAEEDAAFRRFVFLLGAERMVRQAGGCHLDDLLSESRRIGQELTRDYYRDYADLRLKTFYRLRQCNSAVAPARVLAATQTILDRVLFIAFCEDRGLLPPESIAKAYRHADPYNPRPIWDNFRGLFRWVNEGNPKQEIARYNGGLFAADELLDQLTVPDDVCQALDKLASYHYGALTADDGEAADGSANLIDVEILGHIFEQSITDLEQLHQAIAGGPAAEEAKPAPSKRKREGAFYTPPFITRYIVDATLRPALAERFTAYRRRRSEQAKGPVRKVLDNPDGYDPASLTPTQKAALVDFWEGWQDDLATLRIVDPACGSGAFLIEAFEQLHAAYQQGQSRLRELRGPKLFDVDKQILQHNLYGVDLNREAVDICRLSLWIKTAQAGKVLTSLDHNVRVGNSVIADRAVHPDALDWRAAFPEAFADGGFDVVIGNPPYIRQEWLTPFKAYWQTTFESYDSIADIYAYFYELGVKILRPGGRLGFITSGSWVRGNFGEGLRDFLARNAGLEEMIDFGEFQPFQDAEMIRPTIAIVAKRAPGGRVKLWKWLTSGRPPESLSDEIEKAPTMLTSHLGKEAWELEPEDVIELRRKLSSTGQTLHRYTSGRIFRGVVTGSNEVFVIGQSIKDSLVSADPRSGEIIKPLVQGTHLRPWYIEHSGDFLIFTRRGIDIDAYPAIRDYLLNHREALEPKPDDWPASQRWPGRKAGSYRWYEIQDSVDYWEAFEQPKIVWPDISKLPRFSMDTENRYLGNTGFVVPGGDYYLLGVLASWATWFFISKTAQPLRLRADRWQYRLFTQFMEHVPIPDAPEGERNAIAVLAAQCGAAGRARYALQTHVRERLAGVFGRSEDGNSLGELNTKALEWWQQPLTDLGAALKSSYKLSRNPFTNPRTADEWEPYLAEKRREVEALGKQLADAEAEINDRVYRLFRLTQDEVKLLQREVEH